MMHIHFATGNAGKVEDVRAILSNLEVKVEQLEVDTMEPQDRTLEQVARFKVEQALEKVGNSTALVMADDSGLFVDALDGFPGVLSSPFDSKVGKERLLDLVDEGERQAEFRAAVAVHDPDTQEVNVFTGSCRGELVEPRGEGGFGYDPMFLPEGHEQTFAEDPEHKHEVSHRYEALEGLREWLEKA